MTSKRNLDVNVNVNLNVNICQTLITKVINTQMDVTSGRIVICPIAGGIKNVVII